MPDSWWLALVFALMGAGSWLVEHRAQTDPKRRLQVVRPARWVVWLCGDPCKDGTIDLEHGVKQLAALALLVAGSLSQFAGLALHVQAGLVFLAYALVALPGAALVAWARWREDGAEDAAVELPPSGVGARDLN